MFVHRLVNDPEENDLDRIEDEVDIDNNAGDGLGRQYLSSDQMRDVGEYEGAAASGSVSASSGARAGQAVPTEAELRQLLLTLVPDLTDPEMQDIACDRIMGFSIEEIARERSLTEHRVSRKLRFLILKLRARTQRDA